MENLLVTGGCGFIGANFVRYVLEETSFQGRLINVDKLTYAGNPTSLTDIQAEFPDRYVFLKQDICDREGMQKVFEEYSIDAVCHMAAETHVDRSIHGPDEFVQTNVIGTFVLLELARAAKDFKLFHHVSTDEVYGELGAEGLFSEASSYSPNSPYSASKASSDHFVRAYAHTYGLPITLSNCSNNYGPYHFPEKLIPLMILNALEGKSLPVYGKGDQVRDWLYVRDHCRAIWTIMEKGKRGDTYLVGGRSEIPNLQVVHTICDLLDEMVDPLPSGSRRELVSFVKDRPGHDFRYAIDFSKLEGELAWTPEESFDSGLKKTIEWYVTNSEWVESVRTGEYRSWIEKQYS